MMQLVIVTAAMQISTGKLETRWISFRSNCMAPQAASNNRPESATVKKSDGSATALSCASKATDSRRAINIDMFGALAFTQLRPIVLIALNMVIAKPRRPASAAQIVEIQAV